MQSLFYVTVQRDIELESSCFSFLTCTQLWFTQG